MRRREFIAGIGTTAAWSMAAGAQQGERARPVGVLMGYSEADPEANARFQAFRQGLTDLGWVEGRNLQLSVRWETPDGARQQTAAHELVSLAPEVILVATTPATQILQTVTRKIPIVFMAFSDPVATGIVSNMARPEGNATGFMAFEYSMAGKWLSLLKDVAPKLARVTLLHLDAAPYAPFYMRVAQDAGERLALKITATGVGDEADIERAVAAMASSGDGGLVVLPGTTHQTAIVSLADKHRVPTIFPNRDYVEAGGLMSYAPDVRPLYRDGATYVDRILRGAKPTDLPVQFATKFELVINLKTAKALGLDVSHQLQFLADQVIE
jgi:ABC-type uncharacterized transport system substrate-binding protein